MTTQREYAHCIHCHQIIYHDRSPMTGTWGWKALQDNLFSCPERIRTETIYSHEPPYMQNAI